MRLLYGRTVLLWAALLSACVAPPEPAAWLAVGYRTPEETFRTFQTALRADQLDLEYRCLSYRLKQESVRNQALYRTFRAELPWLKYAAWAEIVEVRELAAGRRRVVARVDRWFYDRTFAIDFEREDYYELWQGSELLWDDFHPWESSVALLGAQLVVSVPAEGGVRPADVTELRAGTHWKIAAFPRTDTL